MYYTTNLPLLSPVRVVVCEYSCHAAVLSDCMCGHGADWRMTLHAGPDIKYLCTVLPQLQYDELQNYICEKMKTM